MCSGSFRAPKRLCAVTIDAPLAPFAVMVLTLLYRPTGLYGSPLLKR
jgi:hypothetical protein